MWHNDQTGNPRAWSDHRAMAGEMAGETLAASPFAHTRTEEGVHFSVSIELR